MPFLAYSESHVTSKNMKKMWKIKSINFFFKWRDMGSPPSMAKHIYGLGFSPGAISYNPFFSGGFGDYKL